MSLMDIVCIDSKTFDVAFGIVFVALIVLVFIDVIIVVVMCIDNRRRKQLYKNKYHKCLTKETQTAKDLDRALTYLAYKLQKGQLSSSEKFKVDNAVRLLNDKIMDEHRNVAAANITFFFGTEAPPSSSKSQKILPSRKLPTVVPQKYTQPPQTDTRSPLREIISPLIVAQSPPTEYKSFSQVPQLPPFDAQSPSKSVQSLPASYQSPLSNVQSPSISIRSHSASGQLLPKSNQLPPENGQSPRIRNEIKKESEKEVDVSIVSKSESERKRKR